MVVCTHQLRHPPTNATFYLFFLHFFWRILFAAIGQNVIVIPILICSAYVLSLSVHAEAYAGVHIIVVSLSLSRSLRFATN